MKKIYRVAAKSFALDIPINHPLCSRIDNYAPFEISVLEAGNLAFEAELTDPFGLTETNCIYCDDTNPEMPRIVIYKGDSKWCVEVAPVADAETVGRIVASLDFSKVQFCILDDKEADFVLNDAMMLAFAFSTVGEGVMEMHASVVAYQEKGYLFLGSSGTGKSTHSRLWLQNMLGSTLLNDDNPIVAVGADGEIRVYGSPWSGKTPCYKNESYPIGAFVSLRQAKENRIREMSLLETYGCLYSSTSCLKTEPEFVDALHETIGKVATQIPCFQLDCLPDSAAALMCAQTAVK